MIAALAAEIEARIADACRRAGRPRASVRLVAVSKGQPAERLLEAHAAGLRVFGESYAQELERHAALFPPGAIEWHFIGHLQSNKAKRVAALAAMVHSVDSVKLSRALGPVPQLIEIRIGGEETKSGVDPERAEALLAELGPEARVEGLMCIPPQDGEPRRHFAALRELADRLRAATGRPLPELSMGMSGDFEDAILEGATFVRVGTALFGERLA